MSMGRLVRRAIELTAAEYEVFVTRRDGGASFTREEREAICARVIAAVADEARQPSEAAIRAAAIASGFVDEGEETDAMLLRAVRKMFDAAAALDGVRAGEPTGRTDGKDLGDRGVGAVGLGESPTRPSSPVGVPLTVERLTELAQIFNKETQEYTSEMSRHAVRDFAKWLASRLIPQPEEKTKP